MISDADIARAIGCGPEQKPEWWWQRYRCALCNRDHSSWMCKCSGKWKLGEIVYAFTGHSFREWGTQTGLMLDWLRKRLGKFEIHYGTTGYVVIPNYSSHEPTDWGTGATLPLALCEAVEKARTE